MKRFLSFHRHRLLAAVLLVTVASTLHAQTITTFDIPNSISINPAAINSAGQVVGWYTDAVGGHGFLRSRNGAISSIDVVGATSTRATAINPAGRIVGYSYGPLHQIDEWRWDVIRGFAREINGTINIFDACSVVGPIPQANMTYPQNISPSGEITGLCNVSEGIDEQEFGFVRQADGSTVWVTQQSRPLRSLRP